MSIIPIPWLIAFICAFIFFGAGKQNAALPGGKNQSFVWTLLSLAVSALVIQVFHAGWVLVVIAQAGLLVAIGVFASMRDR